MGKPLPYFGLSSHNHSISRTHRQCRKSNKQPAAGEVSFPYEFPQPGRYRSLGAGKSAGAVRTVVFDAEVTH